MFLRITWSARSGHGEVTPQELEVPLGHKQVPAIRKGQKIGGTKIIRLIQGIDHFNIFSGVICSTHFLGQGKCQCPFLNPMKVNSNYSI